MAYFISGLNYTGNQVHQEHVCTTVRVRTQMTEAYFRTFSVLAQNYKFQKIMTYSSIV